MSIIKDLTNNGLINPPNFVRSNTHYEVMMGSIAYGCSSDNSDVDIYGFCLPNRDILFPHEAGYIKGFGKNHNNFEQYQQHHIYDKNKKREYDLSIFNIVKYFQLCMENNPNMLDSLFVPRRCIIHSTELSEYVRENRSKFLSKLSFHKFKGYAFSQLNKATNKAIHKFVFLCKEKDIDPLLINVDNISEFNDQKLSALFLEMNKSGVTSNRLEGIIKYGYDVKFCYHIVRLLNEAEQILTEHDLDLERNKEQLKAIRRGELDLEQIKECFYSKEKKLESIYLKSKLRYSCDEDEIKKILLTAIGMHYENVKVNYNNEYEEMINKIKAIIN